MLTITVALVLGFLLFGGVHALWKANAEHKKLNDANEGTAIFLDELDKVREKTFRDSPGTGYNTIGVWLSSLRFLSPNPSGRGFP